MAKPQLDALVRLVHIKNRRYVDVLPLSPRAKERIVRTLPGDSPWKRFNTLPIFVSNWLMRQLADKDIT